MRRLIIKIYIIWRSPESGVDRYVHFSGPIFVDEIHYKQPPEFASLANI